MGIRVGAYSFDGGTTVVREEWEVVGGKRTRAIRIAGVLRGRSDRATLDAELDGILQAASETSTVFVSLRTGRRIRVRREAFTREVNERTLTGQFVLDLRADDAYEESEAIRTVSWSAIASGLMIPVTNGGNALAPATITLDALGTIVAPQFSDGTRSLAYGGTVDGGETMSIDGAAGRVWLDGADITPYTTGDFPMIAPGENVLTFTDDNTSSHLADGEVAVRDRWW